MSNDYIDYFKDKNGIKIEDKIRDDNKWIMFACLDEYMPTLGASLDCIYKDFVTNILENKNFIDILNKFFEMKNDGESFMQNIKSIYNSPRYDKITKKKSSAIYLSGFTGHVISLLCLIDDTNKKFKIVVINSGLGVGYHGVFDHEYAKKGNVAVAIEFTDDKYDTVMSIITDYNESYSSDKQGKNKEHTFYNIFIKDLLDHSINNGTENKWNNIVINQNNVMEYYLQMSGTCAYFSCLYPLLYLMHEYSKIKPIRNLHTKFKLFEYMLCVSLLNKIITTNEYIIGMIKNKSILINNYLNNISVNNDSKLVDESFSNVSAWLKDQMKILHEKYKKTDIQIQDFNFSGTTNKYTDEKKMVNTNIIDNDYKNIDYNGGGGLIAPTRVLLFFLLNQILLNTSICII